jgi:hypothetical protein
MIFSRRQGSYKMHARVRSVIRGSAIQEETTAMRGKPDIGAATTSQHSFGPIADDDPRYGGTKTDAEQHRQTANITRERPPTPSTQAFNALLAAELDNLSRRRQSGLDQTRPYTRGQCAAQNTEVWWDQLLAEIEALASELQRKVARFALFCGAQSSGQASAPENAAAVEWMHGALEDLAATALGMEMACEQTFLRASQADFLRANQGSLQKTEKIVR